MLRLIGLIVDEHPQRHPYEAQTTNDDKRHFPSKDLRQWRYADRSRQSAHRRTRVEDRRGESTVFLREIFRCHLDGCREVTTFTECEHRSTEEEEVDTHGSDAQCRHRPRLHGFESGDGVDAFNFHGYESTDRVETRTYRPHKDCPQVTLLCSHPVDEFARKEAEHRVKDGESRCDGTVVSICPVEFRSDEVFPRK